MIELESDEIDAVDAVYHDWLVARRLENQTTSSRLHALIRTHAVRIGDCERLSRTTRGLVRAASFLWRAACLSHRLAVYEDFEDDDFRLTDRIIEDEFVVERAARSAPDWLFFSYMSNTRDAFITIASAPELDLLAPGDIPAWVGLTYKECWVRHQTLFDQAVRRFERALTR